MIFYNLWLIDKKKVNKKSKNNASYHQKEIDFC